jgi:hypothetical protein
MRARRTGHRIGSTVLLGFGGTGSKSEENESRGGNLHLWSLLGASRMTTVGLSIFP